MNVAILLNQQDAELFLTRYPKERVNIIASGVDTFASLKQCRVPYHRLTEYFRLQQTKAEWNRAETISSRFLKKSPVTSLYKKVIDYRYPIHQHLKYLLTDIIRNCGIAKRILTKNKPAICYISNTLTEPLVQKLHNQEFTLFNHVFIQLCKQRNIQVRLIQNYHYFHYFKLTQVISKLLIETIINAARSIVRSDSFRADINQSKQTILFSASNHLLTNTRGLINRLRQNWNVIVMGKLKQTAETKYTEKNIMFVPLNTLIRHLSFKDHVFNIWMTSQVFIGFLTLPQRQKRQCFDKALGIPVWNLVGPSLGLYSSLLIYEINLYSRYIEQLWKTAPFSFVLTSNNIDPFHFALLSFARNHSIPYALLIHDAQGSTFCDFFYKPDDTLLVWGNFQKRLISKEFPTLRCIVTGHPDFDNSMAQTKENQPIFDLKSKKIIRVLVLSTYNPYVQFPNQEVLFDVFRELNKIKKYRIAVTLKSHPSEYHAKLVDLVQKSIDYPLQLSFESADKLIEANDIIVTQSTSAGFRAVLLSKPTVYLNLHDYKDYEPYAEEGAALGVYSLSQLNPSIEALIKQPDICRKDQTIFSKDFCYKHNEGSSSLIIKYIKETIGTL